jgi:intracellular multiplication protein IcmG
MAEQEYKFKEEEYDVGEKKEQPPEEQAPPGLSFAKRIPKVKIPINRRVLIILGIIIVVFIIFQFVKPKTPKEPPVTTTPTTVGALPVTQVSGNGQLFELTQKSNKNSAKIKNIEDELNKTQTALSKLNTDVNNLNSAVQKLSKATQTLARRQAELILYGKGKFKVPKVVYHVKAIVPGRAWLESSDGTIVTVRPGTRLNHYGTVTKIDDRQGIVKTDLGLVIKYGAGDI